MFRRRDGDLQAAINADGGRLNRAGTGSVQVTQETALRHSGVWAARRLRANLVGALPVDAYRLIGGVQVEVPKGPLLTEPGGSDWLIGEWLWASQWDLDGYGNFFGVITQRDGLGLPRQVEPVSAAEVTVLGKGPDITGYRVGGNRRTTYDPYDIWHERQYRVSGLPVGLCPVAYAAWSIGGHLSAVAFANDYFARGGNPSGVLRNTMARIPDAAAGAELKAAFKAATYGGDIFVTGKDWEWMPASAPEAATAFLDQQRSGIVDVARFFDVPADTIDGAVSGSSITYANVSQRNLQLLIMSLGPTVKRREDRLSRALPAPRFVKLNTDALLRMDPEARARVINGKVQARVLAPSEARALDDRQPFTEDQMSEFDRLYGAPRTIPVTATGVPTT